MSVNFSARVIVGILADRKDLKVPREISGCNHR